jgi:hypothetical protein
LPRHRHGAALLNDERPATRGANGSQALLWKDFGPARCSYHLGAGGSGRAKFSEPLMAAASPLRAGGYSAPGSRAPRPLLGGLMRPRLVTGIAAVDRERAETANAHPHGSQEKTGKVTRRPTAPNADHMNQRRVTVLAPTPDRAMPHRDARINEVPDTLDRSQATATATRRTGTRDNE